MLLPIVLWNRVQDVECLTQFFQDVLHFYLFHRIISLDNIDGGFVFCMSFFLDNMNLGSAKTNIARDCFNGNGKILNIEAFFLNNSLSFLRSRFQACLSNNSTHNRKKYN